MYHYGDESDLANILKERGATISTVNEVLTAMEKILLPQRR